MKHLRHALLFGSITGIIAVLFLLSPPGRFIEDEFGLALQFKTRGARKAPAGVVIVNLDEQSTRALGLPRKIEDWPRDVYADLVNVLNDLGAAVIVFDVHFGDRQDEENDRKFGAAMRAAGNVILYQKMVRQVTPQPAHPKMGAVIDIEQEIPPIDVLADAALASVSFPIPKMPVRVNQAWTFKTSAGDMPTLPVVALQTLGLHQYESFYRYVQKLTHSPMDGIPARSDQVTGEVGLIETMRLYRRLLNAGTDSVSGEIASKKAAQPGAENTRLFQALVETYQGENNIYINFHGPPGSLTTYPLTDILENRGGETEALRTSLANRVVFVGAARTTWSEQKDGFYTVFTQPDGLDLSGVEIAATVYANIREGSHLTSPPLPFTILLLACSAILFAAVSFALNPTGSAAVLAGLAGVCFFFAHRLFQLYGMRLPVITWVVLLPPVIYFSVLIFKFIMVRRERTHIKQALHMYLPDNVVEEISSDLSFVKTGDRMVYGVCLTTDARNYTALSEKLEPVQLSSLMKDYFEMLYKSVNGRGGVICNVVGDSMLAMWPSTGPDSPNKENACRAALDIVKTIEHFNENNPDRALPTRIGLHSGHLLMGNIGAEGHYEYAPVGDIVNTASRIENVNKKLGTWILASEETVTGEAVHTRLMGSFLMSGKSLPVTLYQVLPGEIDSAELRTLYSDAFPEALELFYSRQWDRSTDAFSTCLSLHSDDGPSRFFRDLSIRYTQSPPGPEWQGIIPLTK